MGNRATVIFTDGAKSFSPAIYLHWNGGPESVYAFLAELDRRNARADQDYEAARFIQLVGEFFDGSEQGCLSLGVTNGPDSDAVDDLEKVFTDHGDNGFYLVNRVQRQDDGSPTVRRFTERHNGDAYELAEMPADKVAIERAEALRSEYSPSIREAYRAIARDRGVSQFS